MGDTIGAGAALRLLQRGRAAPGAGLSHPRGGSGRGRGSQRIARSRRVFPGNGPTYRIANSGLDNGERLRLDRIARGPA